MTTKQKCIKIEKAAREFNKLIKRRVHKSMEAKEMFAIEIAEQHDINPAFFINLMISNDRNLYYR